MIIEPIVKVTQIEKFFSGKKILDKVSFEVKPKQIITFIGPNGSGKTTLARILLGLEDKNSGDIWFKDKLRISYMPQKFEMNYALPITAYEVIKLYCDNGVDEELFNLLSEKLKLGKLLNSQINDLSGGELKKVMLAASVLRKADLLLLDEPVENVDINGKAEIYKLLELIRLNYNMAIIMISHDLNVVMRGSDHVICINQHICCQGQASEVKDHPAYQALFGKDLSENFALYMHAHNHNHES